MVFTQWGDTLSITPSSHPSLCVTGTLKHTLAGDLLSTHKDSPNLAIKALYAMAEATFMEPNIAITLNKEIPSGAGLGGGSCDAAAMMLALNELWGSPLSINQMNEIGLTLGAELPVCLARAPSRVQGIGDIVTPIHECPTYNLVIVWPNTPLSTASVFKHYAVNNPEFDRPLTNQSIFDLKETANGLQSIAMELNDEIAPLIQQLENSEGCTLARMTGSGSACFGIFDTIERAKMAAKQFHNSIATHTISM